MGRPSPRIARLTGSDGILRVCAWCRRVRARHGRWVTVPLSPQSVQGTSVSHGICRRCRDAQQARSAS